MRDDAQHGDPPVLLDAVALESVGRQEGVPRRNRRTGTAVADSAEREPTAERSVHLRASQPGPDRRIGAAADVDFPPADAGALLLVNAADRFKKQRTERTPKSLSRRAFS